jgi:membrane protein implicated in regulation of membrane protease activity
VKEFVVYTAARFGIFGTTWLLVVGVYALLNGGGPIPLLWPLLVAAVLSAVLSAFLLRGMRDRFAERVQDRAARMSQRFEEMKAKEDVD